MFTRLVAASFIALLPLSALAAGPVMVKSVEVEINLSDLTNPEAATRFATVADDLRNAIAARVIDQTDIEDGVKIKIDISELELSNSFTETFNLADTKLAGNVQILGTGENPDSDNYDLTVNVDAARPYFPAGTVVETLPADSSVYYDSMITAFADAVVRKLGE